MKKNLLAVLAFVFGSSALLAGDDHTLKAFKGTLTTGIVAIGSETTGVVLEAEGGKRYELDFGANKDLSELARKLSGKTVVVTGECRVREGVEIKERHLIEVATLEESKN